MPAALPPLRGSTIYVQGASALRSGQWATQWAMPRPRLGRLYYKDAEGRRYYAARRRDVRLASDERLYWIWSPPNVDDPPPHADLQLYAIVGQSKGQPVMDIRLEYLAADCVRPLLSAGRGQRKPKLAIVTLLGEPSTATATATA